MKTQLDELNQLAMSLITEFAGKNDSATITCLASVANRVRQLREKLDEIQQEIPRLKEALLQYAHPQTSSIARPIPSPTISTDTNGHQKTPRKKIRVEIDWTRIGNATKGKETICEHMASHTLTKWVVRLYQEIGAQILTTLHHVRVNRGPLVSDDPQNDFKNHADGTVYQHQPILDTGHYVLTHSNTSQKVGDIQKASKALGLPPGMVVVFEIEK
jgi:hypothetical protein